MITATRQTRINELDHRASLLELEHDAKKHAKGKPALLVRAEAAKAEAAALRQEIRHLIVTP